jgi:hypothetical protein
MIIMMRTMMILMKQIRMRSNDDDDDTDDDDDDDDGRLTRSLSRSFSTTLVPHSTAAVVGMLCGSSACMFLPVGSTSGLRMGSPPGPGTMYLQPQQKVGEMGTGLEAVKASPSQDRGLCLGLPCRWW